MLQLDRIRELSSLEIFREPFFLVDLELAGSGGNRVLRFVVDTDEGVKVDELTRLSRALSDLLDREDLVPFRYRLEVASPGLDRPLRHPRLLRNAKGRMVRLILVDDVERQPDGERIVGRLLEVDEDSLLLEVDGVSQRFRIDAVDEVRYELEW